MNDECWEKNLLTPPVPSHQISEVTTENIYRRIGGAMPKGRRRKLNRLIGSLATAAAIVVAVGVGYVVATNKMDHQSEGELQKNASNALSIAEVQALIQKNQTGHIVNHVSVIDSGFLAGYRFAFASFYSDGNLEYANIFDGGIGIFVTSDSKANPLQYEVSTVHGFSYITGVIVEHPDVHDVVIIFNNGQVKVVPVKNGEFWFVAKIGATESDAYTQHVIGVTERGNLIEDTNG